MGRLARVNAAKRAAAQAALGSEQPPGQLASGHQCGEHQAYRLLTYDELDRAFDGPRGIYNAEVTFRCKCGRDIYLTDEEPDAVCEPSEWDEPDDSPGCGRRWAILIAVHEHGQGVSP